MSLSAKTSKNSQKLEYGKKVYNFDWISRDIEILDSIELQREILKEELKELEAERMMIEKKLEELENSK